MPNPVRLGGYGMQTIQEKELLVRVPWMVTPRKGCGEAKVLHFWRGAFCYPLCQNIHEYSALRCVSMLLNIQGAYMSKYTIEIWFNQSPKKLKLGQVVVEATTEAEALVATEGHTEHWVVGEQVES